LPRTRSAGQAGAHGHEEDAPDGCFRGFGAVRADAQHNFQRAVQARGAPYRLIRSAEDMLAFVADVQKGNF